LGDETVPLMFLRLTHSPNSAIGAIVLSQLTMVSSFEFLEIVLESKSKLPQQYLSGNLIQVGNLDRVDKLM
jgi:hypothetical protein